MIVLLEIIIYILLIVFFTTFIARLLYIIFKIIFSKVKTFLGVIIEGSEIYWRWRWMKMHRGGKLIYKNIDIHHPERGWTLMPNLKNKLHYAATVNSNSDGIRDIREKYPKRKILFFGDSFCFGEGVDNDETIPYFLEKNLKNIACLNLGIHGYGLDQQYLYLKEELKKYNPLLTCLVIADNDFRRDFLDFRDSAKPKFVLKDGEIILTSTPVPKPEELYSLGKPSLFYLFKELIKNFFIFYGISEKKQRVKINDYILDGVKKETERVGSKLIFVYVNDSRRGWWYKLSYINRYFINYFKSRKIPYLDISKIYGNKKLREMFDTLSGHFTAKGNEEIAKEILRLIKQGGILDGH